MKTLDFEIDQDDLKTLYLHTKFAYGKKTFKQWLKETNNSYSYFAKGKNNVKTFSQWVNGQIISLT